MCTFWNIMTNRLLILGTCVALGAIFTQATAASVKALDAETEAEVVDDEYVSTQDILRKFGRNFHFYYPLLTDSLMLPEISEKENGMDAVPSSDFCTTNQGQRGNCKRFEECFPLLNLPEDKYGNGTNYSDLQEDFYKLSVDGKCSAIGNAGVSPYSNICCDLPQNDKDVYPKVQLYNSPSSDEEDLNSNSSMTPKYTKIVNTWATCGEKQFDTKIIGGQEAIPHEYPWMVSLWGKSGKHICGASLLDNNFVLTAAHCIARYTSQDIGKIRLLLGDHNIHSTGDGHHEVRHVSRIIKHKRFNLQTFVNDIALLRMDRPVVYTDRIRPICLPSDSTRIDDEQHLVVAGWGQTAYKGTSSSVLKKVAVPGVSREKCGTVYNSISPAGITKDMICAGGVGIDSCIGDSGGPLIQLVNNRYEQIGIVSFGRECGYYPGVYTKVHSFLNWIQVNRNKY